MTNLYVFAIGGSGERVMKSLIMILAAGIPIGAKRIIPVFIDNDEESNALLKCKDLLDYYRATPQKERRMGAHSLYDNVYKKTEDKPSFFHVEIAEPIILNKAGKNIGNLQNILGKIDIKDNISKNIKEELDLLFTTEDLEMPLNVGFVGNPNIGSIVLNSLSLQDDAFNTILSNISSNDGIFVVGSLFGGTGAAGLPLIVNTFNDLDVSHKPMIGAGALLPYFSFDATDHTQGIIDTERWDVNSDSFETKTRAALMYYDEYMRDLDYLYYIGDDLKDSYQHNVGGKAQANPAHIVELLAALSVVDFSKQEAVPHPVYKRPVLKVNSSDNSLNLTGLQNKDLKKALLKFQMLKILFENENFLMWAIEQKKEYVQNIKFTEAIRLAVINDVSKFEYAYGLNKFLKEWDIWLNDLSANNKKRKFVIYDSSKTANDENILVNFYASQDFGLAKTEEYKPHFYSSKRETRPVPADVSEALLKAYKNNKMDVDDERKILPILLKIVSDALDDVITNKCCQL